MVCVYVLANCSQTEHLTIQLTTQFDCGWINDHKFGLELDWNLNYLAVCID